mmetsp:Transcript_36547/g.66976  ORF Transcript_36547/g.66976 Transcript_36547/m.66976 type:complete len:416 (-) Transcript_36547:84-1331(-)
MGTCLAPCDKGQGRPGAESSANELQTKELQGSSAAPTPSRGEVQVSQIPEPTVQEKQPPAGEKASEETVAPPDVEDSPPSPVQFKDGDASPRAPFSPGPNRTESLAGQYDEDQEPKSCYTPEGRLIIGRSLPYRDSASGPSEGKEPSWSLSLGSEFKVRCGPNYAKKKQKAESLPSMYDCLSVDVLYSDGIMRHVAKNMDWDSAVGSSASAAPATTLPHVFVVNAQLPDASEGVVSSLFKGNSQAKGISLVAVFRIKPEILSLAEAGASAAGRPPALGLLERFVKKGSSDKDLPFKAIGMVDNIDNLDVPTFVKQYNGKPALITKSSAVYSGDIPTLPGKKYMEVDFDTRKWSMLARTSMKTFKDRTKDLTLRMAYLVEAEKDSDMPEQIMGSAIINFLDAERDAKYVPGHSQAS